MHASIMRYTYCIMLLACMRSGLSADVPGQEGIKQFYEQAAHCNSKVHVKGVAKQDGKEQTILDKTIELTQNDNCMKLLETDYLPRRRDRVYCRNARYGFLIERRGDAWVQLNMFGPDDLKTLRTVQIMQFLALPNKYADGYDLLQLFGKGKTRVEPDGTLSCELSEGFDNPESSHLPKFKRASFTIRQQRLTTYSFRYEMPDGSLDVSTVYSYLGTSSPLRPSGARRTSNYNTSKGKSTSDEQFRYEYVLNLPSDNEFTLTAFGIPEPPLAKGAVTESRPWYIYAAVLGVLCIGIAWYLRRRRHAITTAV